MKKYITVSIICISLIAVSEISLAQNSGFGIGAMINGPTGISYKGWIDERVAIGGAVTFNVGDGRDLFYTHADILVHNKNLLEDSDLSGSLTFYYGGGVALTFFSNPDQTDIDLRAPLGTVYGLSGAPFDFFFEIVPSLKVEENTRLFLNGALGVRYYLN